VMTSPPYFRLRDYRVDGQFGLEPTIEEWVDHLRPVLAECARVLVPTGTLWLNLGDTYSTRPAEGAPRKSLLFGPERLSLALIADGWIVRNKIVWAKTNTLPTSVRDRLATKHEVIYLLTRSWRYFFDLDSVRVPHLSRPPKPHAESGPPGRPSWLGPNSDSDRGLSALRAAGRQGHPLGKNPGDVWSMSVSNYRGAHFATYPVALAERMLRAGCPEKRCSRCLAPWQRPRSRHRRRVPRPTCDCEAPSEPGIVLDPFIGSGSTAVAARRLDRDWLGVELNPDFRRLALERLAATP
jgi:site-specific DNA-methyltransferase (adenine-specific)